MKDKVGALDIVTAGISTEVASPNYPCPKCGKEMLDARTHEMHEAGRNVRICSSEPCRVLAEWTSGIPVVLAPAADLSLN